MYTDRALPDSRDVLAVASSGDVTIESLHDEGATALCCARHDVRVVLNPDTDEFGRDLAGFLDAHRDCLAG